MVTRLTISGANTPLSAPHLQSRCYPTPSPGGSQAALGKNTKLPTFYLKPAQARFLTTEAGAPGLRELNSKPDFTPSLVWGSGKVM